MSNFRKVEIASNDLGFDAWGKSKVAIDKSILHGLWSFDIPDNLWKRKVNGSEVIDGTADTAIASVNGELRVQSTNGTRYTLSSLRHPRYQPNRGHLFSDSAFVDGAGNGILYAVKRTTIDGVTTDTRSVISTGLDYAKGNINDIQIQWRGVGDFKHFQNLEEVYHNQQLGTLTNLSVANPALPISYEAVKGAHTLGNLLRNNSAVRYGIFTEENGIFYEYEYEAPTVNAQIRVGCTDVTSEGGRDEDTTYSSVTTDIFTSSGGGEQAVLSVQAPTTRTINGTSGTHVVYNTRDSILTALSFAINDETFVKLYKTRDSTAVTATYERNWSDDVDYAVHSAVPTVTNTITAFDDTKAELIWAGNVEQDIPATKAFPKGLWLTNGDTYVVTVDASGAGSDIMSVSAEIQVEK